jgi:hypothetical protein
VTHKIQEQETLSPQHAFVVQFRANAELARGHYYGRVEHVVSGHATTFTSSDELLAFMSQIVTELWSAAPEETQRGRTSVAHRRGEVVAVQQWTSQGGR